MQIRRVLCLAACAAALTATADRPRAATGEKHLLYAAVPGIRNYLEYGGIGVLVYDMDDGHRLLRTDSRPSRSRAASFPRTSRASPPAPRQGRLYVSTIRRVAAIDLATEKMVWNKTYEGGADRIALSPDGKILYVPSLEGPHWHAVDAATGDVIAKIVTGSGAHNTIYGPDGTRVYLAGLKSPTLAIADPKTHTVVGGVGPFSSAIRPFTINDAQTLCFVNVNGLLGFEVGDIRTGKMLHRVEVPGYDQGPIKRHGCPSHGIGLTPDEKELWLADGANSRLHIFDATVMPPTQGRQHRRPRPARLDHLQHRRPLRLSVDRRSHRHEDPADPHRARRREDGNGAERKGGRGRVPGRQAGPQRRPVRHRPQAVATRPGLTGSAGTDLRLAPRVQRDALSAAASPRRSSRCSRARRASSARPPRGSVRPSRRWTTAASPHVPDFVAQ